MTLALPLFGSCADISGGLLKPSYGVSIVDQLNMSASEKFGVSGGAFTPLMPGGDFLEINF